MGEDFGAEAFWIGTAVRCFLAVVGADDALAADDDFSTVLGFCDDLDEGDLVVSA